MKQYVSLSCTLLLTLWSVSFALAFPQQAAESDADERNTGWGSPGWGQAPTNGTSAQWGQVAAGTHIAQNVSNTDHVVVAVGGTAANPASMNSSQVIDQYNEFYLYVPGGDATSNGDTAYVEGADYIELDQYPDLSVNSTASDAQIILYTENPQVVSSFSADGVVVSAWGQVTNGTGFVNNNQGWGSQGSGWKEDKKSA